MATQFIDVFLCTCAVDSLRKALFDATYERWFMESGIMVEVVDAQAHGVPFRVFQGWRRWYAEQNAISDPYILAEDDCMPLGNNFVQRGVDILLRNPAYAVLSPTVLNGVYKGPAYTEDGELILANSAGGINFTRKGRVKAPQTFWDEMDQAQQLKADGWLSGYMPGLKMNHLGAGLSTIWPDPYTGITQIADI